MTTSRSETEPARRFVDLLFEHRPAGTVITLVQLPHAPIAVGYTSGGALVERAVGRPETYIGACALARAPGKGPRAATLAAFCPGAWADIDIDGSPIRGSGATVTGHAPDDWAAIDAIYDIAEPTVIIGSGYGLQPWWLAERGLVLHDAAERDRAQRVVHGIQRRIEHDSGWKVDNTADLARIMRIPGTLNDKIPGWPVRVRLITDTGPRYTLDQLEQLAGGHGDDVVPEDAATGPKPPAHYARLFRDGVPADEVRHTRVWEITGHLLRANVDPVVAWEIVGMFNRAGLRPPYDELTLWRRFKEIVGLEAKRRREEFQAAWEGGGAS